jgi:hypothetical protein
LETPPKTKAALAVPHAEGILLLVLALGPAVHVPPFGFDNCNVGILIFSFFYIYVYLEKRGLSPSS